MGTLAELAVLYRDEQYAQTAIDVAIEELRDVDRVMTWLNDESDVGRANATSGDYTLYVQYGGRRHNHMLDPKTGEPRSTKVQDLTVMADDCMAADAAGTALFGMPADDAARVLTVRAPDARIVRTV